MNTKENEIIERFIVLRGQGWSFARLAVELKTSKTTLIAWSRKHADRIRNLRAIEIEATIEALDFPRPTCLSSLSEDFQRLRREITRRDISDIPTVKLYQLCAAIRNEASRHNGPLQLTDSIPVTAPELEQVPAPVISWEV